MTLVIIFGPPAVGKMTVGLELEQLTGFRLFHNHMTVDPVIRLFPFNSPAYNRLVAEFRQRIFEEFAASDARGLIFTFVWAFDDTGDRAFIERTTNTFTYRGADVCFVELEATQAERLRRNETPLRLAEKRPQRDVAGSRAFLLDADRRYQLNTSGAFLYPDRHVKIDNTALEPRSVARRIVERFGLPLHETGVRPRFAHTERSSPMSEYKVVAKEVTSVIWRDVQKAAQDLTNDVNADLSSGWEPQGGIASIQAGTGVYLFLALKRGR
jgi:hypothetical protein